MSRRLLDTNVLVRHWRASWPRKAKKPPTSEATRRWARQLMELRAAKHIVLPIKIEFLAGRRSEEPLEIVTAFLDEFELADGGQVLDQDWARAEEYANRIPLSGSARDFGDCLIRALADRLRFEIDTFDSGMPRGGMPHPPAASPGKGPKSAAWQEAR